MRAGGKLPVVGKAVVLLSGGLDSATTLAVARREGMACHALSFDYDQRHRAELFAAERIASMIGAVEHQVLKLDFGNMRGSALTDDSIHVPEEATSGIPVTYVPARNTIFLSYALGWAEVLKAQHIYIGVNAVDYSGYPDCRPEYIEAFAQLANLATKAGVEGTRTHIMTPLLHLSKPEIMKLGHSLDVPFSVTVSCYQPDDDGRACAVCDSCRIRRDGFLKAGLSDPTRYKERLER